MVQMLATATLATLAGAILLHTIAVLFGARIIAQFKSTWYGALFLSLVAITPGVLIFGHSTTDWVRVIVQHRIDHVEERHVYVPFLATLAGAWAGSVVLPLDWDRPWQVSVPRNQYTHNVSI
jgi:hypothetical protein